MTIQKVAVIGSGVMGSGIAAHVANAGLPVLFFDLKGPGPVIDRMKAQGAGGPFMDDACAALLEPLVLDRDFDRLAEADWICEVVVEDLKVKQDLYARLETVRKPDAVISSNTSTIPLSQLVDGRSDSFRKHFLITHFFNPPRQLRLLELVSSAETLPDVTARMATFCEDTLGKGVVPCFDRPGFIANRIGVFWLMTALHKGIAKGVDIAGADRAISKGYGIPKTGVFGLMDLIGIDLMQKMSKSLADNLPKDDPFHAVAATPPLMQAMIDAGYIGRKGSGGFTKIAKNADGSKTKFNLDLSKPFDPDTSYIPEAKVDPADAFAKEVMDATLDYAASLLGEIADSEAAIDAAMVWGYAWAKGPFALRGGRVLLPHPKGSIRAAEAAVIVENEHAVLRDLGDGVVLLAPRTKMNTLDRGFFEMIEELSQHNYKAMVIGSDAPHFSAGANVALFLEKDAEDFIDKGQHAMRAVRAVRYPIVAAVSGLAIGGGCELALHSTAIVAHAETSIGLVEPRVGVIPGWGGCIESLRRLGAPKALETIMAQWTSQSAHDAQMRGYVAKNDPIVMNRDRLLQRARARALTLPKPKPREFKPASDADIETMNAWIAKQDLQPHDRAIANALLAVLSSKSEEDMWAAEKRHFMALLQTETARARINAVLAR